MRCAERIERGLIDKKITHPLSLLVVAGFSFFVSLSLAVCSLNAVKLLQFNTCKIGCVIRSSAENEQTNASAYA